MSGARRKAGGGEGTEGVQVPRIHGTQSVGSSPVVTTEFGFQGDKIKLFHYKLVAQLAIILTKITFSLTGRVTGLLLD